MSPKDRRKGKFAVLRAVRCLGLLEHPGVVPVVTPAIIQEQLVTVGPPAHSNAGGNIKEGPVVVPVPEVVVIGALPDDLPARGHLLRAGIDSVEDVDAMSDEQLIAVEGIGPKKLKEIREHRKSKK